MLRYFQKSRKKENSQLNQSLSFLLHVMLKDFVQKKTKITQNRKWEDSSFPLPKQKPWRTLALSGFVPFPLKTHGKLWPKTGGWRRAAGDFCKLWDADESFTRWAAEPTVRSGEIVPPTSRVFSSPQLPIYPIYVRPFFRGYNMFLTPLITSWGPPCRHFRRKYLLR